LIIIQCSVLAVAEAQTVASELAAPLVMASLGEAFLQNRVQMALLVQVATRQGGLQVLAS
jgi:hypothetical protein